MTSREIIANKGAIDADAITRLRAFIEAHVALLTREQIKLGVFLHDIGSSS